MEINTANVVSRVKSNKLWIAVCLVALFVVYSIFSVLLSGARSYSDRGMYSDGLSMQKSMAYSAESLSAGISRNAADQYSPPSSGGASYGKPVVKRASLGLKSQDAKSDESRITNRVKDLGGFLEGVSDNDNEDFLLVTLSVKVPASKFEDFVEFLRSTFKVESSAIDLYRVSLEQEAGEISILQTTMDSYNKLYQRAEGQAGLDSQTLTFMMDITNRKLDVMRMMRQYGYSLESKQEDVEFSTLTLTLREEKPVKLVKDGFWLDFRRHLRSAIESVLDNLVGMVTDTLMIFTYVVKLGLILVVVSIPVKYVLKALGIIFDVHFSSQAKPPALSEVYPQGAKRRS